MNRIIYAAMLALACFPAHANWVLDGDKSAVSFVSTKAINVAEVHKFGDFSGAIASDGQVDIVIGLTSVDTGIELRDDRMRDMLFETEQFGLANVSASVDLARLEGLEAGESTRMIVEAMLSLHGESRPLQIEAVVVRTGDTRMLVTSTRPVVINAPEFGLGEGVEALREIAGLPSISLAVPVSFVLAFDKK